jgi:hypothetical protein
MATFAESISGIMTLNSSPPNLATVYKSKENEENSFFLYDGKK